MLAWRVHESSQDEDSASPVLSSCCWAGAGSHWRGSMVNGALPGPTLLIHLPCWCRSSCAGLMSPHRQVVWGPFWEVSAGHHWCHEDLHACAHSKTPFSCQAPATSQAASPCLCTLT